MSLSLFASGLSWRRAALPGLTAALLAGACSDNAGRPVTGALQRPEASAAGIALTPDVAPMAAAHKANPADPAAAIAYAQALRASGAKREALAVLDQAAAAAKGTGPDRRLQLERGLLALDVGEPAKAEKLLRAAYNAKAPDWRLHSGLGAALASRGRQQEAQLQFAKALALAPDQPSVLNNLALSFALDGKVADAERLLRKAQRASARPPQVQQNLALVLGLAGRWDEARALGEATLPPAKAGDNVAYLQRLSGAKASAAQASASLPQPTYRLGAPADGR
jgi:Flp pilus assembly protein TadD